MSDEELQKPSLKLEDLKKLIFADIPLKEHPKVTDLDMLFYMANYSIVGRVMDLLSVNMSIISKDWIDVYCEHVVTDADYFHMEKLISHLMFISSEPSKILKDSALESLVEQKKLADFKRFCTIYCGYIMYAANSRFKQLIIN